jgi:hypothetical protein
MEKGRKICGKMEEDGKQIVDKQEEREK